MRGPIPRGGRRLRNVMRTRKCNRIFFLWVNHKEFKYNRIYKIALTYCMSTQKFLGPWIVNQLHNLQTR
jgi:hypothetical protein